MNNALSPESTESGRPSSHDFLIKVGTMLHRHGTPAHRLERVMTELAQQLKLDGTFLYTPTALLISLDVDSPEEVTYLRRVDSGSVDVDKLIRFDETLELLEARRIDVPSATRAFDQIASSPPPYSTKLNIAACTISCAAVGALFGGTVVEVVAAATIGLLVCLVELLHGKLQLERGVLEPLTGFVASVSALAAAHYIFPLDDRLVTLAALIILIPGLGITVALTELAVGHLSAGVARLAGACVSLLTITIGVALGWRIAGPTWRRLPEVPQFELPSFSVWVAILIAPVMFAILFRARPPQWPTIVGVTLIGFVASRFGGVLWGTEAGAFCGAFAVAACSNVYARVWNRPALVPLTPGIIVLVPGSVGFKSLTAFVDHDTMVGIDFAFMMVIIAAALVGGILTAGALIPPKRNL